MLVDTIDATHAGRVADLLALAPNNETVAEFTWRNRNGRSVYGRTFVRSRLRDDGSVVLEGATRDVTQLHHMEAELRRSEKRYRLLVENGWDVVWRSEVDGTLCVLE